MEIRLYFPQREHFYNNCEIFIVSIFTAKHEIKYPSHAKKYLRIKNICVKYFYFINLSLPSQCR